MSKKYHFVGVGGIGMGALANLVLAKGCQVSGSDIRHNKITESLEEQGANIIIGHFAENVGDADVVIYSSAISADNPELTTAREKKIPVLQRAELLAELMENYESVTVVGAHGKTTTSSMIANLLHSANLNPTTAVGGIVNQFATNAFLGKGEYFVAELDESDGSFLKFRPKYSVITNIDKEHLDHYQSWEHILKAYKEFMTQTDPKGVLIAFGDDENIQSLLKMYNGKYMTYGFSHNNTIYADVVRTQGLKTTFACYRLNQLMGEVELNLPGKHNVANALAAVAVGIILGLKFEDIQKGIRSFQGVRRRFQVLGESNGVTVIDDYAHHPTEIRNVLLAAQNIKRNSESQRRLVTVFQPHRYSRLQLLMQEFVQSLMLSDELILTDVYAASEDPIDGVDAQALEKNIRNHSPQPVKYIPKDKLVEYLTDFTQEGDIVLTLGAGDITQVSHSFKAHLEKIII